LENPNPLTPTKEKFMATKADFLNLAAKIAGPLSGDRTLTLSPMLIGRDGGLVSHDLIVFGEGQLGQIKPNTPYLMNLKEEGTRWSDSFLVMVNDKGEVEDASHLEDDEG
jgi:hypothetical protein